MFSFGKWLTSLFHDMFSCPIFSSQPDYHDLQAQELGREGEQEITVQLEWENFWHKKGAILQNVYVPMGLHSTTEIDRLFITRKGIFVIESKNYSGYIFGDAHHEQWTQTLYAGQYHREQVEKHHFYNPIWQNNTHMKYLKRILAHDCPLYSIIVFSDRCRLVQVDPGDSGAIICHNSELRPIIERIWRTAPDVLNDQENLDNYEFLQEFVGASAEKKLDHVHEIHERLNSTEVCPRCGGKLVLRTARNGPHPGSQFYGCSNYPKCKYTKNL